MSVVTDILPDADVSGSLSLSGVEMMSLLVGLQAGEGMAFIIVSETAPDVVANPRFTRYLWFKISEKKFYDYTNGSSWVATSFGTLALTDITDNSITVGKISGIAGIANQVIASNDTNAYWANVIDLITNGTLAIAKIVAGSNNDFFRTVSGAPAWVSLASVASEINAAITAYTVDKLSDKVANSLLQVNASSVASFVTWATFFDTTLPINTIKLPKLHGGGASNGQGLLWISATNQWTPTDVSRKILESALTACPATGAVNVVQLVHSLGSVPRHMYWVLVNTSAEHNYALNDEIPISSCAISRSADYQPISTYSNATYVGIVFPTENILINDRTTGASANLTRGSWSYKCYYI